jgi:prepilin-type N-terminal cleavage/methylation domain-containing protein
MRNPSYMNGAFTLVEWMIVVAIVGLMAAIAVPSFQKAKRTSDLLAKGYTRQEASAIMEIQKDAAGKISDGAALARARQGKTEVEFAPKGQFSVGFQPVQTDEVSLPSGATDVVPMGDGWYTFRWDGHKYLARAEESKELTTRKVIACLERMD